MEGVLCRVTTSSFNTLKFIISIVLLFTLAACEAEKTDIEYLASAKKYALEGDLKASEIELKNALQQNPENKEARYLLGLQYLDRQLGVSAKKEFDRAVEYGLSPEKVILPIIRANYYQFKYQDIMQINPEGTSLNAAQKAEVYFYRGLSEFSLNKTDSAEVEFEMSVQADPNSLTGQLSKAYLFSIFNNYDDAEQLINKILDADSKHTETYILKSRLDLAQQNRESAVAAISKALELEPNRLNLYISSALYKIANQQAEEAELDIDHVLTSVPNHLTSNLLKAKLRMGAKDWEAAREFAEKVLVQSEVNKEAKLISGVSSFYLESWERARDRLKAVSSFIKPDHYSHRMLSYAEFKLGYLNSAESIVDSIGELKPGDEKLLSKYGAELVRSGKLDDAVTLFETAAGLDLENADILTRLGILKLEQNDASGLRDLEKVLAQDASSFWARAALAMNYLKNGSTQKAIELAQEQINLAPEKAEGYFLLAEVKQKSGDIAGAETVLKSALQKVGEDSAIYQRLFLLAVASKDFEKAKKYNETILSMDPANRTALVNAYRLQKHFGEGESDAVKRMSALQEKNPDDDELKLLTSHVFLDAGDTEKSVSLLKEINSDSSVYAKAQAALGRIHTRTREHEKATPYYRELIKSSPKEVKAHVALVESLLKSDKNQDALGAVRDGLKVLPDNKILQLIEVKVLLLTDREQQALNKAEKLRVVYPKTPKLDRILGEHYAYKKEYEQALKHYEAYHEGESGNRSIIAVAQLNNLLGRKDIAIKLLEDWLKDHPDSQPVRMYLANLNIATDTGAAVTNYRKLVEANDKNFIALNNLAWALGEQGKITEAIEYAEKADKLKPNAPQILDTLGYLLLRSGEVEEAMDVLKNAHKLAPNEPTIAYHYAMVLKESGDDDSAKKILLAIADKDFPEKTSAKQLLGELIKTNT